MKNQLALFGGSRSGKTNTKKLQIAKSLFDTSEKDMTVVYEYLVNSMNLIPGAAICQITRWIDFDFRTLWNEFELRGQMTYYDFIIHGYNFKIQEDDTGTIYTPEHLHLLSWREKDVFDSKMKQRIKSSVRIWIMKNQYQFSFNKTSQS